MSEPVRTVATGVPLRFTSTRTVASRVSANPMRSRSRRPSPLGETTAGDAETPPSVLSTLSPTERVTCSEPEVAVTSTRYRPSATSAPEPFFPSHVALSVPAERTALGRIVRTSAPEEAFSTRATTVARRERTKDTAVCSPLQSPLGVRVAGFAASPVTSRGGGEGTTPAAGRTSAPALICHVYVPKGARVASQVQSIAVPFPCPSAITAPPASFTWTTQARVAERRPVKRMASPTLPLTSGS